MSVIAKGPCSDISALTSGNHEITKTCLRKKYSVLADICIIHYHGAWNGNLVPPGMLL